MRALQRIKPCMLVLIAVVAFGPGSVFGLVLRNQSEDAALPPGASAAAVSSAETPQAEVAARDTTLDPEEGEPAATPRVDDAGLRAEPTAVSAAAEQGLASRIPYFVGIGVLALALAAFAVYFWVLQPRKKRKVLQQALEAIARGEQEDLVEAEKLLDRALISGLSAKDIADARFALGYVRAKLKKYPAAAAVIAELRGAGSTNTETLYLDLWLQSRLDDHDAVERIFGEHEQQLWDVLDSNLIASIAFFERARQHLTRREIDGAFVYYKKVRELGVKELVERIPGRIEDQQVVLGIMALFDSQFEEARKRFESARSSAQEEGSPTLNAELGILLCEWRAGSRTGAVGRLEGLIPTLEKAVTGDGARSKDDDAAGPDDAENGWDENTRLLRDVLFWYAMAYITGWEGLEPGDGLPEKEHMAIKGHLDRVKHVDPEMSDPYLVGGLIDYYFGDSADARKAAVETLKLSLQKGVNLADVRLLLDREEKLEDFYRNSLKRFLGIVKNYLEDPNIPEEMRKQLQERLQPYSRFEQIGDFEVRPSEYDQSPTLEDLQHRSGLLRSRVERLVRGRSEDLGPEGEKVVRESLEAISEITGELNTKRNDLESAEYELLGTTGEFLLNEEEPVPERQADAG